MNPFAQFELSELPASAEPVLAKTRAGFGFVPNLAAVMALSPASLNGYLDNLHAFSQGTFSPAEQQLILLTSSVAARVPYAVAVHTALALKVGLPGGVVQALRENRPVSDARLETIRLFTHDIAETHGRVPDTALARFIKAGFDRGQVVEILFALAAKEFVYMLQRVANVPLDEPLQGAAWQG
jgi:alkylhydroperoxidase family enzyme